MTPTGFDTLSPKDLLMARPCMSFLDKWGTLIGKPYSLRANGTAVFVSKGMDPASVFKDSFLLCLDCGFVVL